MNDSLDALEGSQDLSAHSRSRTAARNMCIRSDKPSDNLTLFLPGTLESTSGRADFVITFREGSLTTDPTEVLMWCDTWGFEHSRLREKLCLRRQNLVRAVLADLGAIWWQDDSSPCLRGHLQLVFRKAYESRVY